MAAGTLHTIGHSTRTARELIELLRAHGVEQVVDVRTIPRSRHNPQFTRLALARSLHAARIGYRHLKALGGLRHARPDSINLGWRNASFRGYADHMQTREFAAGLRAARAARGPAAHGHHVCRGLAVALPPVAHRGRAHGGPMASAPYPEPKDRPASPAHALSPGALRPACLPESGLTRGPSGQTLPAEEGA